MAAMAMGTIVGDACVFIYLTSHFMLPRLSVANESGETMGVFGR